MPDLISAIPDLFIKKYAPDILESLYPDDVSSDPNRQLLDDNSYNIFRDDAELIKMISQIPSPIPPDRNLIELGCGDPSALHYKSIPLCSALKCRSYLGLDRNKLYLHANYEYLKGIRAPLPMKFQEADIFRDSPIQSNNDAIVAVLGHTIGAIPSRFSKNDATDDLYDFFMQRVIQSSGYLLCTFDMSMDPEGLLGCYGGPETQKFLQAAWSRICATSTNLNKHVDAMNPIVLWSDEQQEIQFGFRANRNIAVDLPAGSFTVDLGEELIVGVSRRFSARQITNASKKSGLYIEYVVRSVSSSVCIYIFRIIPT